MGEDQRQTMGAFAEPASAALLDVAAGASRCGAAVEENGAQPRLGVGVRGASDRNDASAPTRSPAR